MVLENGVPQHFLIMMVYEYAQLAQFSSLQYNFMNHELRIYIISNK